MVDLCISIPPYVHILILNLLVIFVIFFNILISLKSRYTPTPFEIIQLISCVFGEELFFRGIILSYFKKTFNKPALNIFIVSALFSFSHIINLFSQKSTIFIAVQLLFAFSLALPNCNFLLFRQYFINCTVTFFNQFHSCKHC